MKHRNFVLTLSACAVALLVSGMAWAAKGGIPGKPPPSDEEPDPMDYPFYFWRLGHMDGPHDSSKALGISRDGKVAVGATVVVDFNRAWRMDVDWAISTEDDGQPPLYNELQVQEDIGKVAPSQFSAAYAASDMTTETCSYDKVAENYDWCGSLPVGSLDIGEVSYGIEWLLPPLASTDTTFENGIDYWTMPDFGGGISDMKVHDVSADGVILVGTGNTQLGLTAFYADINVLDENGVPLANQLTIQDAVTLQTLRYSSAQAVSADGTIIAGFGGTQQGNLPFVATVLDATTDPITLESTILPRPGGGKFAEAYAMTPDGTVIAGRTDTPKGPVACIWFRDATQTDSPWVVKPLGSLSKKSKDSMATGIAYRGDPVVGDYMVVGWSKSILYDSEAFVWSGNATLEEDEIGYFYDLEYILTKTGAAEASSMGSEWILNQATGISDLGDRIVGWGTNPEGGIEAWLVDGYPLGELVLTHE